MNVSELLQNAPQLEGTSVEVEGVLWCDAQNRQREVLLRDSHASIRFAQSSLEIGRITSSASMFDFNMVNGGRFTRLTAMLQKADDGYALGEITRLEADIEHLERIINEVATPTYHFTSTVEDGDFLFIHATGLICQGESQNWTKKLSGRR